MAHAKDTETNPATTDADLVTAANGGSKRALEALVMRHQGGLYGFLTRMMWSPTEAEDATQEVLVKIVTKLSTFEGRSSFKTWAYGIAFNHALSEKRKSRAHLTIPFEDYAARINACDDAPLSGLAHHDPEPEILAEEAKRACISGMLLCLSPDQRAAFTLGAIMGFSASEGAGVLDVTPETFRKKLSRARADMRAFMEGQCGLVNPDNPCRCPKKTRAFIEAGVVDPTVLRFNPEHVRMAKATASGISSNSEEWLDLFRRAGRKETPDFLKVLQHAIVAASSRATNSTPTTH